MKKILVVAFGFVVVSYFALTLGYNLALNEKNELETQLTSSQSEAASLESSLDQSNSEYDDLLSTHNKLVDKWNQQQKDIAAGKYTQYVQAPSYNSRTFCTTSYFSSSSMTSCY